MYFSGQSIHFICYTSFFRICLFVGQVYLGVLCISLCTKVFTSCMPELSQSHTQTQFDVYHYVLSDVCIYNKHSDSLPSFQTLERGGTHFPFGQI
jgi:hypothetical protein